MTDRERLQLITDLSRAVIAQTAPNELVLFRFHQDAFIEAGGQLDPGQSGKDEILGFGTAEAVPLLTPVVMAVMVDVVDYMTEELRKSVKAETGPFISNMVRGLFAKLQPAAPDEEPAGEVESKTPEAQGQAVPESPQVLTPEHYARVREVAYQKALKLKLSESKATILADSIVGGLVTS